MNINNPRPLPKLFKLKNWVDWYFIQIGKESNGKIEGYLIPSWYDIEEIRKQIRNKNENHDLNKIVYYLNNLGDECK